MQEYFSIIKAIADPVVANYSVQDMQQLRKDIEDEKIERMDELHSRAEKIVQHAEEKALEWKEAKRKESKKEEMELAIKEAEDRIQAQKIEDKEKAQELLNKIASLKTILEKTNGSASSDTSPFDSVEKEVLELESTIDDTLISEDIRREVVKAIIKQLRNQEFTIDAPQIYDQDGKNYVKIVAKRPSGKTAICTVDLHGKIAYKFHNYEGMTCLKDIEKFNVSLEKIYSVKLSDERVLCENPDRLSVDARKLPKDNDRRL